MNFCYVIARIPILCSLFKADIAPFIIAHNCLVTKDHIVEAPGIDARYCDTQQVINTTGVPARQYCNEPLQGVASCAEERVAPLIQTFQQALYLIERGKGWRCH